MSNSKYIVVNPGGAIEMLNGDMDLPVGSSLTVAEAWAVFKITATNGAVRIQTVKDRGNVTFEGNTVD